jgi:sugar/nucleoside kinase (ribokinase family)
MATPSFSSMTSSRQGILAGGNFSVDHVKIIDAWPDQDMLVNIRVETSVNGGGPYNVLKDLARMQVGYPLQALGLVGEDSHGDWIIHDCATAGVDPSQLQQTTAAPTSYTDTMMVASTGRRTFFHHRGANALLGEQHFNFTKTNARIFHLGYLMLLDEMDRLTPDGRSVAGRVLESARRAGLLTSVDIVSTEHPYFSEIAHAAMPHTDYLIINEIEAGKIVGHELRRYGNLDIQATAEAARALIARGVKKQVVIHFAEGALSADADGCVCRQGSLELPEGFIIGATGAGDAFAAGYLHAVHEGWSVESSLELAICTAAACLREATPSGGLRPVEQCLSYLSEMSVRSLW